MIINWLGLTSFKIQGEKSILVIDPFDNSYGLKSPRLSADIVAISETENEHLSAENVKGTSADSEPFIITTPGEYEVKNIFVSGLGAFKNDKRRIIIYRFEIDGVSLGHLGTIDRALVNGEIEKMEGVDILFVPVGGGNAASAKQATEIISQLEPRIVIPTNYSISGLKTKTKLETVDAFCKEIGVCPKEKTSKFKV